MHCLNEVVNSNERRHADTCAFTFDNVKSDLGEACNCDQNENFLAGVISVHVGQYQPYQSSINSSSTRNRKQFAPGC
jgi:hypothetical protein